MSEWDVVETTPAALQTDTDPADDQITTGSTPHAQAPSQDDWAVVDTQPVARAPQAPQPQAQDDQWGVASVEPAPEGEWSVAGSAAAGAAKGAVPSLAGLGAGLAVGGALGGPVGIVAGLSVGALTSWMTGMGQDKLLAAFGFDKPLKEAEKANPRAFFAGEMAPAAALLRPGGVIAERALGGAIGGGAEAAIQTLQGDGYDPAKIAMAGGAGALLPNVNRYGSKLIAAGANVAGRYRGGNNPNPDLKEIPMEPGQAPDITVNDAPEAPRSSIPTTPQMESATVPPSQAAGTADVKPPPADVHGAGNPEGAPMAAREGAKPSDPTRNYSKTEIEIDGQRQPALEQQVDAVVQNETPVSPDVATAMRGENPEQVQRPPAAADVPAPGEAAPTTPERPAPPPPVQESKVIELPQSAKPHRTEVEAPPPDAPVDTGLAPQETGLDKPLSAGELRVVNTFRRALVDSGHGEIVKRIDSAPGTPRQKAMMLQRGFAQLDKMREAEAQGLMASDAGKAYSRPDRLRVETPRQKLSTGAKAMSKADADRKQASIAKYQDVFTRHGPLSDRGKSIDPLDVKRIPETRAYVRETWDAIMKEFGGDPFVKGSKSYVPAMRDDNTNQSIQWIKALRRAAQGKTGYKEFARLHKAPEAAAEDRAVGRTERDILSTRHVPENVEDAGAVTGERPIEREHFDPVPLDNRPNADNSVPKAENELRAWINDLSNNDYDTLASHYDVRAELQEPGDPAALLTDMMKTLADAGKRRVTPGKTPAGEVTSEVELPAKKVDLPEVPQSGRKLDKNSEEFKRLAAQYNQQAANEPKLTKEQQIAASEAKERSILEASTRTEDRTSIDATNPESVWKKAADFIKDEGGGGDIGGFAARGVRRAASERDAAIVAEIDKGTTQAATAAKFGISPTRVQQVLRRVRDLANDESGAGYLHTAAGQLWARFRNPANPSTPGASQAAKDYANTLSEKFRRFTGDSLHRKLDLQANMHAAIAEADRLKINTPYWHRQISLAEQDNRVGSLPQHVRDFYEQYIVPVREQGLAAAREMKDLNDKLHLGWDLSDIGKVTTKSYQPRYQIGKQQFDDRASTDAFDPFTGRTLAGWAPNLLDRKWFALEATSQGGPTMRMVFERNPKGEEGAIRLWRPGQPTLRIKTPPNFEGKIGDTLELKVQGKPVKFTVDQASTKEIERGTGGQVKFHENALWAWTKMADDMTNALEQAKLYDSIKGSAEYKGLATTDREVARERGYSMVPTRLREFATEGAYKKDVYLPDAVRWAFDDFHRPGFGGTSEGLEKLRNFNVAMLKVFNTNAPLVHVLNEANLFAVGRGFKWLSPKANYGLARNIGIAMRSVNTQDALQREMRNAGVNPLLATTKVGAMFKNAAEAMGMEVTRNWRAWDAPFKPMGITAKEAGEKLYHLSSDVTWRLSDYMTTLRYMEERAAGWAPEDAAKRVNKFMSDYQVDSTIMGSRALQQFLTDPLTTSFGRYKAGVWRSLSYMAKDLVKGDDMLRQQAGKAGFGSAMSELKARQEALGQLLAVGVIATIVGPAADKMLQKLTGDENAEFRARGVNAPVHAALKYREKGVQGVVTHAWSPSPFLSAAGELPDNKTFSGKEIIPTGDLPGIIPEAAAGAAEYAAQTVLPPYANVSKTYSRPEGSLPLALGNLALEQIGADIKSDAALKRENQIDRVLNRNERMRQRRPGGIIPDAINRLTD